MKFFNKKNIFNKKDNNSKTLLSELPHNSRYAESFRTLRTNLTFSSMDKELNTVLVTSAVESEGKTNTAINLGYTMAQAGRKVLLIDADLRRPRLSGVFSLKKEQGFTDIVSKALSERVTRGNLRDYAVGDLLQLAKLQKRTGGFDIDSGEFKVAIYFIDGKVVDIYWKNRPEEKKLANTLVRKNILTQEEATLALGHQKKSVQRLGTILFSMGLVSKEKITKELAVHTVEVMRIFTSLKEGLFTFSPLSKKEIQSPISQDVDFDQLFGEFLDLGEELVFIKNSIRSTIYPTNVKNMFVLPSGKIPPNPSELIGSNGTEFLMALLKKQFDFIILDTPPVMPATDAMLMAPRTDGAILVVKAGNTERKIVKTVVDRFKNAELPILGVLLNGVDLNKDGYYRYYKKYYSSYYGK